MKRIDLTGQKFGRLTVVEKCGMDKNKKNTIWLCECECGGDAKVAESIIQSNREHCFLCGANTNLEPLDCHHVFGGPNRKKSEQYGLKVYIHHNKCHIFGEYSVHKNAEIDKTLKKITQRKAMQHYGWTTEEFIKLFGKNYI